MTEEFRERTVFIVKQRITNLEKKSTDMNKGIIQLAETMEQAIADFRELKFERDQGLIIQGETVGNSVYSHSMLGTGRSITGTPPLGKDVEGLQTQKSTRMGIDPNLVDEATRMRMRNFREINNGDRERMEAARKDNRMCGCEACVIF